MKGEILFFIALTFAICGAAPAETAETPSISNISTSECQKYPLVTCTSADTIACVDTLQMAADTRAQLAPLLNLGKEWRFPVHIHIMTADDPLLAKINREAAAVFAQGTTMKIEAVLPATDPDAREFVQRQFVTALLWEKFFATTTSFDTHTNLDTVPLWLSEGLREWLNEDSEHNRERIVQRAVQIQCAPTLDEVTGWKELSHDRLLGLWQRSFCYYLVDSLIQPGPKRDNFQQWLGTFSGNNPASPASLFPTEAGWQHELVDATSRSRDIVYTWDETVGELASIETIAITSDKPSDTRICTLDTVASFPLDKNLIDALQSKIRDLTALELRAHTSWHSILELYRSGLSALTNNNPNEAKKFLQEAHQKRVAEMANHQKIFDYMNWFEVTKDYNSNTSHFNSYFATAEEMEKVQADPAHPNPIRADLLQVESQSDWQQVH